MGQCALVPTHDHDLPRCEECGKPRIRVYLPNGSIVEPHDDGSICDAVVEFVEPEYIPGTRTDLHSKVTKKGTAARDTRYERAMS